MVYMILLSFLIVDPEAPCLQMPTAVLPNRRSSSTA